ncbi:Pentapeptide repeats (9 copies) [Corynebacterium mustelae]|uniref:Pentapeptide repeats (9 copies) n=1 Tax=Corynebacterium mustelae TaxID=571915 RepID=A0A0G3H1W1_9CORY|nr:pentapeptide repeat-containing protein [Corynebacterium mustelae]AKK05097.1 Pentapeptide repeats (9 copies) [Corynebacterium mustelae]
MNPQLLMKKKTYTETWRVKTRIGNRVYEDVDFTGTDFNHPIFSNVTFKNCIFRKCNLDDARLYSCDFYDCVFDKVDLRGVTIGAHTGIFRDCVFNGCNFQRASFYEPEFYNCTFDKCRMKGLETRASYFENCTIIGHLAEIVFYNNFYDDISKKQFDDLFHSIDFSKAHFGEYVIFEGCDLSRSVPPRGHTFEELLTKRYSSRFRRGRTGIGTPGKED